MLPLLITFVIAKIALKLVLRSSLIFTILTLCVVGVGNLSAQVASTLVADSLANNKFIADTTTVPSDSATADTLFKKSSDNFDTKKKKQVVEDPVFYSANDSMSILVQDQVVLLWGEGKVEYQDIELSSEHIISDLENQEIFAIGGVDTTGRYFGNPDFKKGSENFASDSMRYNIKSGKGIIYNVKSEQGEGYLHSDLTKRDTEGHIHMKGGKYTTCDADHPHFYMELTKAIAIPDDKIISGPAFMVVEDVPIPILGLPFGFFPSSNKRGAGVIIPMYGEEKNRGFFLRGGGWYQPLGQYLDMTLLADVYSKGSWAVHWGSDYKVRYRFNGNMKIDYAANRDNSNNSFPESEDFKWTWMHRQDPKANPTQNLSATVNFSSSNFDRYNSYNANQIVNQQTSSSISFTKSFPGTPFNLSMSANARQNLADSTIVMDLPKGSFNASTIYPFRKKSGTGKLKWYENIGFSYNSEFTNHLDIRDTMLFKSETWQNLNYGFRHSIPVIINLKSDRFKMLTVSPSLRYDGVMNSNYIKKSVEYQAGEAVVVTDTIQKLTYAHAINPSISVGLTPKVTGMYLNTRPDPKVIAVRHVMQPRASFSYTPDMSRINPNYYDTVFYAQNGELGFSNYSYYDGRLYRAPSFASESGSVSLGLSNNLEMKVRAKNDTVDDGEPQKVVILRNLNLTTSYNPFVQEFKWSDVSLTTGTSLFKNKFNVNLTARFSPYDIQPDTSASGNITYRKVNEFYYDNEKRLLRFTNLNISAGLQLRSSQGSDAKGGEFQDPSQEVDQTDPFMDPFSTDYDFVPGSTYGEYVDFSIPWSININYTYSITRPLLKEDQRVTNTVNFSGDFSLTQRWKIGFRSGYDFENKKIIEMTTFNIRRDLHCWEMRFNITPLGTRKQYSFFINAKASILRDLKWDKRQSWYDNL